MKDEFNTNFPVVDGNVKDADFTVEDVKKAFDAYSRSVEDDDDNLKRAKKRKVDWQETTDSPEEEAEDTVNNILTDEPVFPEDDNPPPPPPPDGGDGGGPPPSGNFVSNYITIERKEGQPPKDKVMMKALEQAVDQGWEKIYVFDKTQRKPDIAMAQYIQSFIEQNGFAYKICCCCDPDEYKSAGTAREIHKNNLRSGATRGKNIDFK